MKDYNKQCRWCGHTKECHRNGIGSCYICKCLRFRTTGETENEWFNQMMKNMCEREGGEGHKFEKNEQGNYICFNCGTEKLAR